MRMERRRETAACKLVQHDEAWEALRSRLPENLDELARQNGALRRRRKVSTGEQLLRLILVYVTCWLSLRTTAAWAQRALGLALTDSALSYRFDCAVRFLRELVQRQLPSPQGDPGTGPAPARVRIVDATGLNEPGTRSTNWCLHTTYSPLEGPVGFELTDEHEGEHLGRAVAQAGDLVIVDMGYGHARDVRLARERDEHCLVRVHPMNLAMTDDAGHKLEVKSLLKQAEGGVVDQRARLVERGHPPVEVRLVITRLPKEKVARARQRLRRAASKKGRRTPRALAVQVCGYFFCVTTVSAEHVSAAQLLSWYRVRWQVELWFKRCKSLLGLDRLAKACVPLVHIQIWGRLLVALLAHRLHPPPPSPPPAPDACPSKPPQSEWRRTTVGWLDIVLAVYGGVPPKLDETQALERLRERPRRRCTVGAALATAIEQVLNLAEHSQAVS